FAGSGRFRRGRGWTQYGHPIRQSRHQSLGVRRSIFVACCRAGAATQRQLELSDERTFGPRPANMGPKPHSEFQSKTTLRGEIMLTRRHVLASALAAPAILRLGTGTAHAATALKISHQFPGGTIDKGDFRDRLCRMFAAEVAKRSGGEIAGEIYPNSSLVKTNAQFSAMRKGALDISLYPLPYAGGELPETNIGLMPGLVSTYAQGLRWKKEPVGKALT